MTAELCLTARAKESMRMNAGRREHTESYAELQFNYSFIRENMM